jgi:hypothetical protein
MSENDLMFMPDSMIAGMLMHISLEMHHNHRALIDEARRRLAVRHELNRIAQQQRWIPVSEAHPPANKMVLVHISEWRDLSVSCIDPFGIWRGYLPTHWMPLPEPPKREVQP